MVSLLRRPWKNADRPGDEEMIAQIRDYHHDLLLQQTSPLSPTMVGDRIALMAIALALEIWNVIVHLLEAEVVRRTLIPISPAMGPIVDDLHGMTDHLEMTVHETIVEEEMIEMIADMIETETVIGIG
jgi:hypothetical protein